MECDEAVAVGVRGTIAAAAIGDTLPHERVIYTLHSLYRPPPSLELHALRDEPITLRALNTLRTHPFCSLANLSSPGMDVLANEISLFRRAVGSNAATIVDVTLAHEGRDPAALVALSVSTGVSIVMSTGCAPHVLDAIARARDESEREEQVEALIGRMVSELTKGVDATQPAVRAGVIAGAILEPRNELLPILAAVQLRTSAPLLGYLPKPLCSQDAPPAERAKASAEAAASAVASLERLTTLGVSAAKILVLHGQHLLPLAEGMYELLRTGASVCFDSLGNTWCAAGAVGEPEAPTEPAAEREVVAALARLACEGYGGQLLISHGASMRLQLCEYGGCGLAHVHASFLPRALRSGLHIDALTLITRANASRLLCWWRPPPPPARLMRMWECSACHEQHAEAVNAADVLPTDRVYFEKFDFRYCSTSCLGAHRRADFIQPFSCPPPAGKRS
mmetsp:Transcript_14397/g.31219  ORF Transcript_14397/g.31219 Transcript_14397/m.31219 type:complete len:452 (-) Transcript_14397:332-1687(-)|eukprot:CAMPEP_0183334802 /NCGR_PEP_ID=MMETSP0164_2-20130417/3294_1 /TAXON_ID=221442 /ORGANISM="Coccolithus pelagicus ssp braarudi, Strain PLY182g" /LENGTH=451 /DNA_ID=CAMNT_0025504023 /DNA_START=20 /DNA_END=1375 /DNA_ORIENTATION=+